MPPTRRRPEDASDPRLVRPSLVSLFTGAGGLDIGLELAGFRTVVTVDNDPVCVETLRRNQRAGVAGLGGKALLEGANVICASVADLSARDLRTPGSPRGWRPDLLAGGPPCQPFSSAGKQRGLDDVRGRLFEHFVRLAAELKPRFILFENVRGIVTAQGPSGRPGEVLDLIRTAFEGIGYGTHFALLNAADFGLPQRRVRCFMFGARQAPVPEFPETSHTSRPSLLGAQPWVSLGHFLAERRAPLQGEIVRPSPQLAAALASVPAGSGLKSPGAREATRPGGHWGYKQGTFIADPKRPARTVTAAATQDWIRGSDGRLRRLTLRECAGLQGFPAAWEFCGTLADGFRQVGNAVPTVFGFVLGDVLATAVRAAPVRGTRPVSRPLPEAIAAAIRYTHKELARNGASRRRVRAALVDQRALLKGLGGEKRDRSLPLFEWQA